MTLSSMDFKTWRLIPLLCTDNQTCSPTQFKCKKDLICIERSLVCDGHVDCPDGTDEDPASCDTLSCFVTEFMWVNLGLLGILEIKKLKSLFAACQVCDGILHSDLLALRWQWGLRWWFWWIRMWWVIWKMCAWRLSTKTKLILAKTNS